MIFAIRNIKKRMSIDELLKWFERDATVIDAYRHSERGKVERIYIIGASGGYGLRLNATENYISDTGLGHGGKGLLQVKNIVESDVNCNISAVASPHNLNEKIKLPVWIMV